MIHQTDFADATPIFFFLGLVSHSEIFLSFSEKLFIFHVRRFKASFWVCFGVGKECPEGDIVGVGKALFFGKFCSWGA